MVGEKDAGVLHPIRLFGFGLLMGWHFLILYSPVFTGSSSVRQTILNASLAVGFLIIGVLGTRLNQYLRQEGSVRSFAIGFLAVAVLGVIGAIFATQTQNELHYWASTALLGLGEAGLMFLWIHLYSETSVNYSAFFLSMSMVIAGIIGFAFRELPYELTMFALIALPVICMIMFRSSWRGLRVRSFEQAERGVSDSRGAQRTLRVVTVQLSSFSLAFGILQGLAIPGSTHHFTVDVPFASLGAAVAGLIIFAIIVVPGLRKNWELAHRFALGLMLLGLLTLPFLSRGLGVGASFMVMAAYITFDLRALIVCVNLIRTFDLDSASSLAYNRFFVYLMFSVGIAIGFAISPDLALRADGHFLIAAICVAIVMLVTLIFPMVARPEYISTESVRYGSREAADDEEDEVDETITPSGKTPWRICVQRTAEKYALSPRETEVLFLIAKGRNAEYVQSALQVSSHTAKSHIANIYRKMGIHSAQELLDVVDSERDGGVYDDTDAPDGAPHLVR